VLVCNSARVGERDRRGEGVGDGGATENDLLTPRGLKETLDFAFSSIKRKGVITEKALNHHEKPFEQPPYFTYGFSCQ
jgi:hypothetical protein